ncbi:OmpA family protein [Pannonibacter indicus]|nr:OmpA family protein [Pannonibacter indicus]
MRGWGLSGLRALVLAMPLAGCAGFGLTDAQAPATPAQAAGFAPGTEEEFMLNAGRRIHFAEGSAALTPEAEAILIRQAAWLNIYPQWLAKVQGHADDPGGEAANKRLSEQRAKAVFDKLVALGVDPQRLWFKGYGIERPETDCDPQDCARLSRQVTVNLRNEFDDSAPQFKRFGR